LHGGGGEREEREEREEGGEGGGRRGRREEREEWGSQEVEVCIGLNLTLPKACA
jgi:hypothetical protein